MSFPSPVRAAQDLLAALARRGICGAEAIALAVTWPCVIFLIWVWAHLDRAVLRAHGLELWMDGHAYWAVWHHGLYTLPPRALDAYLYSPAFAQVLWPLTLLPFAAFAAVWWSLIAGSFWWLLSPLPWIWRIPALILTGFELQVGNVNAFLALMLVLGRQWPAVWALGLLTKVTPGLGLLWFVARREWHPLALALGITAVLVAVSAAFDPHAWGSWIIFLVREHTNHEATAGVLNTSTLPVRLAIACAFVLWGARTNRPWTLAPALTLGTPLIGTATVTVLAALPRLVLEGRRMVTPRNVDRASCAPVRPPTG